MRKTKQEAPEFQTLNSAVDTLAAQRTSEEVRPEPHTETRRERNARLKAEKRLRKNAKKLVVPRTVQETIPYARTYPDSGIIETSDGVFTKAYQLEDINYQVARDEEQTEMFLKFAELHNYFDSSSRFQFVIVQQNRNLAEFEAAAMLPMKNDGLDYLRTEQNQILAGKIRQGKNELIKYKYLVVQQAADSYSAAQTAFLRLDSDIKNNVSKIGNAIATPMTTAKRLECLHDIYNPDAVGLFGNNYEEQDGQLVLAKENFSFEILRKMGITTKDMIAPESFAFKADHGKCGKYFFRAMYLKNYPATLKDSFLKDLTDVECHMVTSVYYQPIDPKTAQELVRRDMANLNADLVAKQKAASKSGYSVELISPELRMASEEAAALREDITRKNQKLFYQTFVVVCFAETMEQLEVDTAAIQAVGRKHLVEIRTLTYQQELGLDSALPLANNRLAIRRTLITESAAVFMPFVNQELNDRDGGMYYGLNAVSHNLIMLNRRNSKNGNGMIFGSPGSGKSMAAKQEMLAVLLGSNDDVVVIDPEGEYARMARMLGGEIIRIAPGGNTHINPFDIAIDVKSEDDPITQMSDFIYSFMETIMGDRLGLSPGQRSIIDRCVKKIFEPYLASYNPDTRSYNDGLIPTLEEFYYLLRDQDGYEALQLADSLEIYAVGSQALFAHKTNVNHSKRFVVYDIRDIGSGLKALGLLVIMNSIWMRTIATRQEGKNTWFYIDEMHILFQNSASTEFLKVYFKRARKYGGIPTGITQNVSDLLENDTARTIISNSEFVEMLNQSAMDGAQLAELLHISPTQMDFITNAAPGHGLIYDGTHIVPFVNELPKSSKAYVAMTTKLSEVSQLEG